MWIWSEEISFSCQQRVNWTELITKVHKTLEESLRGSLYFTLNIIIGTFVGILRTELNLAHCIATASHAVQRVRQTERQMAEVVEAREGEEEWLLGYPAPRPAAVLGETKTITSHLRRLEVLLKATKCNIAHCKGSSIKYWWVNRSRSTQYRLFQ